MYSKKKLIILLSVLAALIILFSVVTALTVTGALLGVERAIYYDFLVHRRTSALNGIINVLVYLGNAAILVGVGVLFEIIPKTRHKFGFSASMAAGLTPIVYTILKNSFMRPRPEHALIWGTGSSFPSGHAFAITSFVTVVIIFLIRNIKNKKIVIPSVIALCLLPPFVSFCRLYLGSHYLGDTLAGMTIGVIMGLTVSFFIWPLGKKVSAKFPKKLYWIHLLFYGKPATVVPQPEEIPEEKNLLE